MQRGDKIRSGWISLALFAVSLTTTSAALALGYGNSLPDEYTTFQADIYAKPEFLSLLKPLLAPPWIPWLDSKQLPAATLLSGLSASIQQSKADPEVVKRFVEWTMETDQREFRPFGSILIAAGAIASEDAKKFLPQLREASKKNESPAQQRSAIEARLALGDSSEIEPLIEILASKGLGTATRQAAEKLVAGTGTVEIMTLAQKMVRQYPEQPEALRSVLNAASRHVPSETNRGLSELFHREILAQLKAAVLKTLERKGAPDPSSARLLYSGRGDESLILEALHEAGPSSAIHLIHSWAEPQEAPEVQESFVRGAPALLSKEGLYRDFVVYQFSRIPRIQDPAAREKVLRALLPLLPDDWMEKIQEKDGSVESVAAALAKQSDKSIASFLSNAIGTSSEDLRSAVFESLPDIFSDLDEAGRQRFIFMAAMELENPKSSNLRSISRLVTRDESGLSPLLRKVLKGHLRPLPKEFWSSLFVRRTPIDEGTMDTLLQWLAKEELSGQPSFADPTVRPSDLEQNAKRPPEISPTTALMQVAHLYAKQLPPLMTGNAPQFDPSRPMTVPEWKSRLTPDQETKFIETATRRSFLGTTIALNSVGPSALFDRERVTGNLLGLIASTPAGYVPGECEANALLAAQHFGLSTEQMHRLLRPWVARLFRDDLPATPRLIHFEKARAFLPDYSNYLDHLYGEAHRKRQGVGPKPSKSACEQLCAIVDQQEHWFDERFTWLSTIGSTQATTPAAIRYLGIFAILKAAPYCRSAKQASEKIISSLEKEHQSVLGGGSITSLREAEKAAGVAALQRNYDSSSVYFRGFGAATMNAVAHHPSLSPALANEVERKRNSFERELFEDLSDYRARLVTPPKTGSAGSTPNASLFNNYAVGSMALMLPAPPEPLRKDLLDAQKQIEEIVKKYEQVPQMKDPRNLCAFPYDARGSYDHWSNAAPRSIFDYIILYKTEQNPEKKKEWLRDLRICTSAFVDISLVLAGYHDLVGTHINNFDMLLFGNNRTPYYFLPALFGAFEALRIVDRADGTDSQEERNKLQVALETVLRRDEGREVVAPQHPVSYPNSFSYNNSLAALAMASACAAEKKDDSFSIFHQAEKSPPADALRPEIVPGHGE